MNAQEAREAAGRASNVLSYELLGEALKRIDLASRTGDYGIHLDFSKRHIAKCTAKMLRRRGFRVRFGSHPDFGYEWLEIRW